MRHLLLTSAAVLGLALAAPSFAQTTGGNDMGQGESMSPPGRTGDYGSRAGDYGSRAGDYGGRPGHQPGVGLSEPLSRNASNIDAADSRGQIAPRLPTPAVGPDAGPQAYLHAARQALARNRTGEAQEALERAETRLLDIRQSDNDQSGSGPMLDSIERARQALGHHDVAQARSILDETIAQNGAGASDQTTGMGAGGMGTRGMGSSGMGTSSMGTSSLGAGGMGASTTGTTDTGAGGMQRGYGAANGGVPSDANGYPPSPGANRPAGTALSR